MRPPIKRLADLKPSSAQATAYARPTPKVARRKTAKVMTDEERAAFLARDRISPRNLERPGLRRPYAASRSRE